MSTGLKVKKNKKVLSLSSLKRKITQDRQNGKIIAFTNGCFDILHYGHVSYLEKARKKNRILIIGLNSDASIRKIKGSGRPIIAEDQRAALLAAMSCVDYVILFNERTPYDLIKSLKPDVLIKGADWKDKGAVGSDIVKSYGGRIEFVQYVSNLSTTNIIEGIKSKCTK